MKWYTKYLQIYGKSYTEIPEEIINKIGDNIVRLQNEHPLVTVSIIAHNEEKHIVSCLWSLVDNRFDFPIEITVVNNDSTDRTEDIIHRIGVIYYNEEKMGPGFARQCGLDHAKGKYYLCIDADTIYPPYYIKMHVQKLMKPHIACTYSLWSFMPDKNHSKWGLRSYEILRDLYLYMQSIKRPELCVRGMTFGFNTEIGRNIGFRTDIIRGEDGSMALAMKSYGKLIFIISRKARVLTGNATLEKRGSLFHNLNFRIRKAYKNFFGLFFSKKKYNDKEDNIIK